MNKDKKKAPKWYKWVFPILLIGGFPLVLIFSIKSESPGEALYKIHCENCHMQDGKGLKSLIPPLANTTYLTTFRDQIPCILRNGITGQIMVDGMDYNQPMPGNEQLSETDIANLINFIGNNWGNKTPFITPDSVKYYLTNCPK